MTDDDPTSGVCVPAVEAWRALGVRARLPLTVNLDCGECTGVPPGGTIGLAAVGRSNRPVFKPADEREEDRSDGILVGLLYFSG